MSHQHFKLVDTRTVTENSILGSEPRGSLGIDVDMKAARREVAGLSERYGFDVGPTTVVSSTRTTLLFR